MMLAGVFYSLASGLFIGGGMILSFSLFTRGQQLATAQPIVKTAVVVTAVLISILFLRERITVQQGAGLVLSLLGIYFLSR